MMQEEHTTQLEESSMRDLRRRAHKIIQDSRYSKEVRKRLQHAVKVNYDQLPAMVGRIEFGRLASELIWQAFSDPERPIHPAVKGAALHLLTLTVSTLDRSTPAPAPPLEGASAVENARRLVAAACSRSNESAKPLAQLLQIFADSQTDPREQHDIAAACVEEAFSFAPEFESNLRAWLSSTE